MPQNISARANFSFEDAIGTLKLPIFGGDTLPVARIPWSVRITAEHAKAVTASGILNGIVAQKLVAAYFDATTGGTVFTDDTTDATDAGTADVLPFAGTPVANDAQYYGGAEPFTGLAIIVATAGTVSNIPYVWEYWNGSAFVALPNVNDGVAGSATAPYQTAAGTNIVTWRVPADWQASDVTAAGGHNGAIRKNFFVRLRATAVTTDYTVEPTVSRALTIPVAASSYKGTATGSTATTLTDSGAAWITNGFAGCTVTAGTSTARILSNTATALTVDAWVGGTPATTANYTIFNTGLRAPGAGVIDQIDIMNVVATTGAGITNVQILNLTKGTAMAFTVPEALVANVHTAQAGVTNEIYFEPGDVVAVQFIGTEPASSTYDGVEYMFFIR